MKKLGMSLLCVMFSLLLTAVTATAQTPAPPDFAVLAGAGITNTGATTINGADVGSFPTLSQSGFGSVTIAGGTNHFGDAVTQGAQTALTTAYNVAVGDGPPTTVLTELGGQNLVAGVYNSADGTFGITGTLTLIGTASDVFIFKAASTLITAAGAPGLPASKVVLVGVQPCNVFWQVGSSATLGTYSVFQGTILALTSITATTGATVNGSLLARNGAVTLDTNTITASACAGPPPPPTALALACPAPTGQVFVAYSSSAVASGGVPLYTFSVASGGLPAGLTLNTATGAITGTPTAAGSFTVKVTDSTSASSSSCAITIAATPPPPPPPAVPDLTITKTHTGNFQQGGPGSYTLIASNLGPGPTAGTVTVIDTLPAGLTATAISGSGWSCTLSPLSCTRSDVLAAGASYAPITVTVSVANNLLSSNLVVNGLTFQPGDILLSMKDGTVQWRRHDWTLVKTITSGPEGQAKGLALDATENLFVTHYYGTGLLGNDVAKFDPSGNLIGSFGSGYNCNPASIVFDHAGNAYVGHADCSGNIFKFDSLGNLLAQYNVAVENRGSSHILLGPDGCTMYYTSEGADVKRFNVCTNTQMPDFNTAPLPDPIGGAQQFALLPDGGMLVANLSVIVRLDAAGNLVRTYDAPGDTHCWLGIALDTDGASFWSSNWCGSSATRFDIATGSVIESHVASDTPDMVKQILVVPPNPLMPAMIINTAAVSGGGEVNLGNDSASDPTLIVAPLPPILSVGMGLIFNTFRPSTVFCVGATWELALTNALTNAAVSLMGTTNGQSWTVPAWGTTDANGNFSQVGTFAVGSQGSYTLNIVSSGLASNTVAFVVLNCGP
jgi:uncharacterized repeat protein (TIGR01451 family)